MKKKFIDPEISSVILNPRNSIMTDMLLVSIDEGDINYSNKAFRDAVTVDEYNMWKGL